MDKIIEKYLDYCCEIACNLELMKYDDWEEERFINEMNFKDSLSEKEIKDILSLRERFNSISFIERLKDSLEEEERLLYEIYKEITD